MDSNAVFAIVLLIVGLAILTAEIFIPSGGLLGVITFLSLLVSLIFAYRAWGVSHPNLFGAYCVMLLLLVPTVIGLGFYVLPQTSFGKKILLEAPTSDEVTPFLEESRRLENLIGRFGTTLTMLNPSGLVSIAGDRLQAASEGLSIESGSSVQIVDVRGQAVIVRLGKPPEVAADDSPETVDLSKELDFEYPSSL